MFYRCQEELDSIFHDDKERPATRCEVEKFSRVLTPLKSGPCCYEVHRQLPQGITQVLNAYDAKLVHKTVIAPVQITMLYITGCIRASQSLEECLEKMLR